MVKLRTKWGKAKGDEVADDDDHDYDEDADQCWYLGVSRGERGRMLKKITAVHLSLLKMRMLVS